MGIGGKERFNGPIFLGPLLLFLLYHRKDLRTNCTRSDQVKEMKGRVNKTLSKQKSDSVVQGHIQRIL